MGHCGPRSGAQASHEIRRDGGAAQPVRLVGQLQFNTKVPPFNDPALRRALFPAVNQSDYMQAVVGEQVELMRTGVGLFALELPLRTDVGIEVLTGPRDLDLARRLVKAAGYTGAPIVQMANTDSPRVSR